ncbi:MAG: DUF6049 family protein, partial [Angustibacter sp.]
MVRTKPSLCSWLLAAFFLTLLPLSTPGAAWPTNPTPMSPGSTLTVSSVSPPLLTPGRTLVLQGVLRNDSSAELTDVSIRLRAIGPRLGTRGEVASWLDGLDSREGVPVGASDQITPIAPKGQADFQLSVSAAALGLPRAEFGTFPIAVEAEASVGGAEPTRVGWVRTTVAAQQLKAYVPQQVSWLVPLTGLPGTAIDPAANPQDVLAQIAHEVGPGSRLRAMLELAILPGVSWAVDPQLVLALETALSQTEPESPVEKPPSPTQTAEGGSLAPPETKPSPRSTPEQTRVAADRALIADFYAKLREEAPGHEVLALPYADPDLELLTAAGQISLLPSHHAAGESIIESALDIKTNTELAWPTGSASDSLLASLAGFGYRGAILDARTR